MINKIDGPGPIRTTTPVRKTGKTSETSSASFAKHLDETEETGAASATSSTGALGSVTGVLGMQEVDDATAHASKGKARANDILDKLEDIRMQLLDGALTREKLLQLVKMVNNRRPTISDPHLSEILDEIDLRAQVELAKYAQSS